MGLLESICKLEENEDIEKCEKCENFRNGFNGEYCTCWGGEPIGPCNCFDLAEFWETKRGY